MVEHALRKRMVVGSIPTGGFRSAAKEGSAADVPSLKDTALGEVLEVGLFRRNVPGGERPGGREVCPWERERESARKLWRRSVSLEIQLTTCLLSSAGRACAP